MAKITNTRTVQGRIDAPLEWAALESFFDACFGLGKRSLPQWPRAKGHIFARWQEKNGSKHEAGSLEELGEAYQSRVTYEIEFSSLLPTPPENLSFFYRPALGDATLAVTTSSQEVLDSIISRFTRLFPLSNPRVFISYSHDSEEHKAWVRQLATDLRASGIDTTLDQWDLAPGQDLAAFMHKGISSADRVLLVCSDKYVSKANAGTGGVGYERLIVTSEVIAAIDTKKFVPIVRQNPSANKVPGFMGPRLYIDFEDDTQYKQHCEDLAREIHGVPALSKPPLGPNPFSGVVDKTPAPVRAMGPTGVTTAGKPVLSDAWFEGECSAAKQGFANLGFPGQMELRFALHHQVSKSQIELLNAMRKSEIRTFGWPIGVLIETRDEYRPRPYADGVKAEISSKDHQSYDYWAIRRSGDFYLLQSLFEDTRVNDRLFFNTRIVRIAESLLFASNLYSNLGVPQETQLSARFTHRGLKGRRLGTSNPNRMLGISRATSEDASETELVLTLGKIREDLVKEVQKVAEPLFLLFDFQQFEDKVYDDIVRRFEQGEVT